MSESNNKYYELMASQIASGGESWSIKKGAKKIGYVVSLLSDFKTDLDTFFDKGIEIQKLKYKENYEEWEVDLYNWKNECAINEKYIGEWIKTGLLKIKQIQKYKSELTKSKDGWKQEYGSVYNDIDDKGADYSGEKKDLRDKIVRLIDGLLELEGNTNNFITENKLKDSDSFSDGYLESKISVLENAKLDLEEDDSLLYMELVSYIDNIIAQIKDKNVENDIRTKPSQEDCFNNCKKHEEARLGLNVIFSMANWGLKGAENYRMHLSSNAAPSPYMVDFLNNLAREQLQNIDARIFELIRQFKIFNDQENKVKLRNTAKTLNSNLNDVSGELWKEIVKTSLIKQIVDEATVKAKKYRDVNSEEDEFSTLFATINLNKYKLDESVIND